MGLMMSGSKDISAFPSGESILEWAGTITGPPASVYEGKTFKLSISFSETYPHQAPVVKFTTPTFHPNVDQAGNICLDILKDQWTPTYNVRTVLLSIQSLLADPNNDDPLNQAAAALWANQDEFAKMVDATYAKGGSSSS
ncbi:vih [Symbiodinium sp. KB8]|nr:vih [Symbiodinium sp. KB8]